MTSGSFINQHNASFIVITCHLHTSSIDRILSNFSKRTVIVHSCGLTPPLLQNKGWVQSECGPDEVHRKEPAARVD